ncbi:regulator of chromosome condensation 1/beta-lactamase-inhibitor protein II [Cokeromyces recurvatus]|uniref:regulator of chromosome condensation 1/beta-lactamase-inhibitor protein II n=1 Tax=Cokeromyces recurvatus TaxID=90255 RepID=UPI00221E40B0|nr:regulator of chromosome condensation 1/beta-lactamase-inhibitor protein II [Cokeromyces recurvatus]KAI7903732.1 regulator of chromosome condensation 1/beta-lactamase-inhibitor protein II [Cokeromyces recurvatus]
MLDKFPRDILLSDIIPFLDSESIIQLSTVSKYFYLFLANDEFIWKKLCIEEFNIPQDNAYRISGWKRFFKALKYHAKVYTWGENRDQRLGLDQTNTSFLQQDMNMFRPVLRHPRLRGYSSEVTIPQEVTSLRNKSIIDITSGGWSFHALDTSGFVWMWGTIQQGITSRQRFPVLLQTGNEIQPKIRFKSISSGRDHVIGLAKDGTIWHWSNHIMLQRVQLDIDAEVVQVAANWNYSSVLTDNGFIYIIPKPDQIAPSQMNQEPHPTQITLAGISTAQLRLNDDGNDDKIVQIAGLDGFTLALTRFGRVLKLNTLDPIAFSQSPLEHVTELVHFSSTQNEYNDRHGYMKRFITGAFNNFAVYTKDQVMLGNIHATKETIPNQLKELENQQVCKVSFGDYHYGAITNQGKLFTWGKYSSGALGHGGISKEDHPKPQLVESLSDKFVFAIGFGGWQSSVLAINLNDMNAE